MARERRREREGGTDEAREKMCQQRVIVCVEALAPAARIGSAVHSTHAHACCKVHRWMRTHLEGNRQHDDGDELEDALEEVGLILGGEGGGQVALRVRRHHRPFCMAREGGREEVDVSGWMC